MTIQLTQQAERILRELLVRQPGRRPEELIEQGLNAIAERAAPKRGLNTLTNQEFEAWLDAFAAYSDQIPPCQKRHFSRNDLWLAAADGPVGHEHSASVGTARRARIHAH